MYARIAASVSRHVYEPHPTQPGHFVRVEQRVSPRGVAALDATIQATLRSKPGSRYDDVVRTMRLNGKPLPPELARAAEQLRVARESRLL